jgi:hypothetical protein
MDTTQYILLSTVIAGVTEMLNRLRAKDYWVVATIATSAIIGGTFGFFGFEGLNIITGLSAGFGISGAMSIVGSIGNKSQAKESTVLGNSPTPLPTATVTVEAVEAPKTNDKPSKPLV